MNQLTQRLGLAFPLFQAGMGGVAGPALASATAEAGAGGILGLYRSRPSVIGDLIAQTRMLTNRPFGVNLIPELMEENTLGAQIDAVLQESDASVFFNFFGLPDQGNAAKVRQAGRAMLIMVGSAAAMQSAEALGADAVILQGIEAGGHLLGTLPLDDLLVQALNLPCAVPLLAAGGIASGHHFYALHRLGVAGCLCGTLFAATQESRAHSQFKQRLVSAKVQDTVITDLFDIGWPGRRHRVLRNVLTEQGGRNRPASFIATVTEGGKRHLLSRYSAMVPVQQTEGRVDEMAMYCGESVCGVSHIPSVRERVQTFMGEFYGCDGDKKSPIAVRSGLGRALSDVPIRRVPGLTSPTGTLS
jgi:nitronate monooxygenase